MGLYHPHPPLAMRLCVIPQSMAYCLCKECFPCVCGTHKVEQLLLHSPWEAQSRHLLDDEPGKHPISSGPFVQLSLKQLRQLGRRLLRYHLSDFVFRIRPQSMSAPIWRSEDRAPGGNRSRCYPRCQEGGRQVVGTDHQEVCKDRTGQSVSGRISRSCTPQGGYQ